MSGTTVFFRNFSGTTCDCVYDNSGNYHMVGPAFTRSPEYYVVNWSNTGTAGTTWNVGIWINGKVYKYTVQLDSGSSANVYIVANNLLDLSSWTPDENGTYNKYLYSEGFDQDNCYCVGDSVYSPAANYTKYSQGSIVIQVPGAYLASLTPVSDFQVNWASHKTIDAPATGPSCPACKTGDDGSGDNSDSDDSSNWYWWAAGIGGLLLVLIIILLIVWYARAHSSKNKSDSS